MSRKPQDYREEDEALARFREELKQRFPLPAPTPTKRKRATGKTLGLVVLALAAGALWLDPAYQTQHLASQVGQRQALQLADGSQVLLDSDSELTISWHLRTRQVELQRGQALFQVSPRVYRPFLVDAGGAGVRVVGTRFNVNRNGQDVQVTVAEGKVAVRGRATEAVTLLEPGQQLRVRDGIAGPVTQVSADDVTAWKDNRLVFASTPLAEVIATLQRYHRQPIRLIDPGMARLPVSGVFDSAHVERLLALLPAILPVSVATAADGAVLIKSRDTKK
ncbi:FecR domain-containing protein [Pseudomonas sp. BIGb0427]|uniref:FecR family protein n=1 Tax=unclassified Pseudomonas TaxID=196821 RepID=UPI0018A71889|nr:MULTISPECIES: FecR domain-containing protein [unclassified Pseudomonas]QPG61858.1 FecR domain-containing protein [Pseudomonas sp. BIGb0427]UVM69372.1 FecR domain-containing protein [Pseudomonas sp. B21-009]